MLVMLIALFGFAPSDAGPLEDINCPSTIENVQIKGFRSQFGIDRIVLDNSGAIITRGRTISITVNDTLISNCR